MSFGTVSFEELLGHFNEVYKKNQNDLMSLQDHIRYSALWVTSPPGLAMESSNKALRALVDPPTTKGCIQCHTYNCILYGCLLLNCTELKCCSSLISFYCIVEDYVATRWYRAHELCGSFFSKCKTTLVLELFGEDCLKPTSTGTAKQETWFEKTDIVYQAMFMQNTYM
ncbi:PREDICTED: uncharacterized protein LOC109153566 isoform X1 [Ipomoea nil]|uniref:uncharacterized protein LOC109153566 isoform X1 n=1 Tax=Ipomoea nil TaxID=35883 RepID=UPI0009014DC5|nr:PREDICTED: uncharacterized protein LOC109153566 isoform X1 [Ipomoea nil]XP_019156965.1 PREDICTED: uncharacterized protein LOC109153566 isoform X1 [Ipomoea nil]XP_019156966.1 PREDICTED: uncharacterized protein LOC109153566 isoform X1 [Ipomoea nil]